MLKLLLSIWLAAFAPTLYGQRFSFQYYGQQQGLTNLTPQCILQDRTGFVWVGTQNGLFRYDGAQFIRFGVEEGLPSPSVESMHETRDGTLWIGTTGGLAKRNDTGYGQSKFERVVMKDSGVEAVRQNAVTSDSQGRIFVGTGRGLFVGVRENAGYRFQLYVPPVEKPAVTGIHVDSSDKVWLWCSSQICQFQAGAIVPYGSDLKVTPNRAASLITDLDGNLWARSADSLFVLQKGSAGFQDRTGDLPDSNAFSSLYVDREGALLVPTDLGLARRVGGGWDLVGKDRGLAADSITSVFQDREGSLWVGVAGSGLARWKGYRQWESYTEAEGLGNANVWAIVRDARGTLWAGNDKGLYYLEAGTQGNPSRWHNWDLGRKSMTIDQILPAADGTLWIGSSSGMLARINPDAKSTQIFGAESGLTNNHIFHFSFDGNGRLWLATRGGLYRGTGRNGRPYFEYTEPPGYEFVAAFDRFLLDREHRLWIGGRGSLLRLTGDKWEKFSIKDGLPNYRFERLAQTVDGGLWVGFRGGSGIAKITFNANRLSIQPVQPRPGAVPTLAIALDTDIYGRLWHTTDDGVDFLDGTKWRHYGSADGLVWDDCNGNAFFGDVDGSVWIGTSQGISHFRLPKVERAQIPPAIIESYSLGDNAQRLQDTPSVPFSDRTFTANFTALTFVNESAVRFRYRLKGLEEDWTEARVREVRYPSLPAGSYTLEVMARNFEGDWSTAPASVSFVILPAWWQTWAFRIACFIALLSAACILWMWRFRRIIETQRQLELAVEQRTAELVREQAKVLEEKKNVEEQKVEIERLLHESQRAMQFKSQFLANMSHEIRTPLNGILGMTDLTLDSPLDPEQRNHLQMVRSSAKSLLSVINDILDFSKVEAGKLDLENIDFDLRDHVNNVLAMLMYRSREKNLLLHCKIDGGVPNAMAGDPGRLRQILVNLLGNAVKFTDAGEVLLHVSEGKFADEVQSGDTVLLHFSVRDQGIGIPAEQHGIILEPFRQADESVTRKYGGTGLGLAICTQLVALMNGRMWLESEVGKGSTFHFTARFNRAPAKRATAARDSANEVFSSISQSLRILVAEDNTVNQRLMSAILQKKGHLVSVVASGTEAVSISAKQHFDLVLMDMQMPEMDGFEATAVIREREKGTGRRLRIVAVTASAMSGDRERCLAAGLDDYLAKPIDAAELNRILSLGQPPAGTPPVLASAAGAEEAAAPGAAGA